MDPDANLREQLDLARMIIEQNDPEENEGGTVDVVDACRLAELVVALDEWLSRRGFLPKRWKL